MHPKCKLLNCKIGSEKNNEEKKGPLWNTLFVDPLHEDTALKNTQNVVHATSWSVFINWPSVVW